MHTALALSVSACFFVQGLQAAPAYINSGVVSATAQTSYHGGSCEHQSGSCIVRKKVYETPQNMRYNVAEPKAPLKHHSSEKYTGHYKIGDEQFPDDSQDEETSYMTKPMIMNVDLNNFQPKRALLDQVNGYSARSSRALSKSGQFDQTQMLDQTLYQPLHHVRPQTVINLIPRYRHARPCRKYSRRVYRQHKIRRFSCDRY